MRFVIVFVLIHLFAPCVADTDNSSGADSELLQSLFDADQEIRSEENRKAGNTPTLQEERDRRFAVFQLISEGKVRTANDFFHAGMILHHTSSMFLDSGEMVSLGTENKLFAFFLFRRAHALGHKSGYPMMAAAYNYYLGSCGVDEPRKYGYKFEGDTPIWRPNANEEEKETLHCGFDPRPYFD